MPFKKEPEKYAPLELLYYLTMFDRPRMTVPMDSIVWISGRRLKGRTLVRYATRINELVKQVFKKNDKIASVKVVRRQATIEIDEEKAKKYIVKLLDMVGEKYGEPTKVTDTVEELLEIIRSPKAMLACIRSVRSDSEPTPACKILLTILDYATEPVYLTNSVVDYFVEYYNNDPVFADYIDNILPLEHLRLEETIRNACGRPKKVQGE